MRTIVEKILSQNVSKRTGNNNTVVSDEYVIPPGKTLNIVRFMGGREAAETEVRCELIVDDNGAETVLFVGYAENFDVENVAQITGDGTKKVVLRLVNGDNGDLHMTGIWRGIYDG